MTTRTTSSKKTKVTSPKPLQRGTDETVYQQMQVSGGGLLKLLGFDPDQADPNS